MRNLNSNIIIMISINFLSSMVLSICYFLQLYFVNEFNFTMTTAGLLLASYSTGTMFGGLIGGHLADFYSAKKICTISLMMEGLFFLNLLFLKSILFIAFNLFCLGFAAYSVITTNYAVSLSYADNSHQRIKIINLLDITNNLGLGIASLLIGFFSTKNMKFFFLIAGFISLSIGFYLLISRRFKSILPIAKDYKNIINHGFSIVKKYYIYFSLLFAGIIISQLSGTYAIYLNEQVTQYNFFSILFALNTFLVVFLQLPLLNIINKFDHIFIASIGIFFLGIGMSLLVFNDVYIIILSCLIYTLGEMLFFAVAQSIIYENSSQTKKGSGLGKYRMIVGISRIIGPIFGGYLYQTYGAEYLWITCGLIGVSFFLIFFILFKYPTLYSHTRAQTANH